MNEGRLFLYVSPKVALPFLFLILMVTSLLVHASLLYNTTWFSAFWEGSAAAVAEAPAAEAEMVVETAPAMEEAPAAEAPAPEAAPAQ